MVVAANDSDQELLSSPGKKTAVSGAQRVVKSVAIAGVLATGATVLSLVWYTLAVTRGMPVGWNTFAMHPVLMTLAFGFLAPVAVTSYRGLEDCFGMSHSAAKTTHALLMTAAMVCGVLGVVDMWIVHNAKPELASTNHMLSAHSWIGMAAISFFGVQWVTGLVRFYSPEGVMPGGLLSKRAWLPVHIFLGTFATFGTMGSIPLGILSLDGRMTPGKATPEQIQFEVASLLVVLLALCVGAVLFGTRPRY